MSATQVYARDMHTAPSQADNYDRARRRDERPQPRIPGRLPIVFFVFSIGVLFSFSAIAAEDFRKYHSFMVEENPIVMVEENPIASSTMVENSVILLAAGGNLKCYGNKNWKGKPIWTGNSAHNCCNKKVGGKSWACSNGTKATCSKNKDYHCP